MNNNIHNRRTIYDEFSLQEEGISCPKCKCHMSYVLHTRRVGELLVRERECRACGFQFKTTESA